MGPLNNVLAFDDVRDLFEKALARIEEGGNGIRVRLGTRGAAIRLRHRMNKFRATDRKANAKVYPEDDPNHNASIYDTLQLRIPPEESPDSTTLIIERRSSDMYEVEDL
jgi:hypothetical protein